MVLASSPKSPNFPTMQIFCPLAHINQLDLGFWGWCGQGGLHKAGDLDRDLGGMGVRQKWESFACAGQTGCEMGNEDGDVEVNVICPTHLYLFSKSSIPHIPSERAELTLS